LNNVSDILEKQRKFFDSNKTRDVDFRIKQLKALRGAIKKYENEILKALRLDLNKSEFEGYATEIALVLEEINYAIKHVRKWSRPKRAKTPIIHFLSSSYITTEPYGVTLIMSPWNYPFQLAMSPVVGAMAAGNCVFVKPSEYSFNTAEIIEKIVTEIFTEEYITVVRGGREANKTLLDERFDYIFFTGGATVGQIVMKSAAEHLTPVTLELGGKSPCIVDETANIKLAAKRIIWGKLLNGGQTCVAPDYLCVHKSVKAELVHEMIKYIKVFYGDKPEQNADYPKAINQKHFERVRGLLGSGKVVTGGRVNEATRQIAPTIMDEVSWDSAVMQEEIFGPILPIMEFDKLTDITEMLKRHPKPLALYLFTNSRQNEKHVVSTTSYGGGCINDVVIHVASHYIPFGGVGNSGMGHYHGKNSYETFTHPKGIIKKSNLVDVYLRYPPFKEHLKLLKKLMK
jgi:NAD-dependent aldehyde dehydrogenases